MAVLDCSSQAITAPLSSYTASWLQLWSWRTLLPYSLAVGVRDAQTHHSLKHLGVSLRVGIRQLIECRALRYSLLCYSLVLFNTQSNA
jgi:hypothetical protein